MTIDEVIDDSIGKTTHRSTLVAAYAIRKKNADFIGYVEARLNPHGSQNPVDWETTWIGYWQLPDGQMGTASGDDLHELLKPFPDIDLTPAMLGAPVEFVQRMRQQNQGGNPGEKSNSPISGLVSWLRGRGK